MVQFRQFLTVICPGYDHGGVLSFHISYSAGLSGQVIAIVPLYLVVFCSKPLFVGASGSACTKQHHSFVFYSSVYMYFAKGYSLFSLRKHAYSNILKK